MRLIACFASLMCWKIGIRFTDICTVTAFDAGIEFSPFSSLLIFSRIQVPDQFIYRHIGWAYPDALAAIYAGQVIGFGISDPCPEQ
jgi:hypothetical protein